MYKELLIKYLSVLPDTEVQYFNFENKNNLKLKQN